MTSKPKSQKRSIFPGGANIILGGAGEKSCFTPFFIYVKGVDTLEVGSINEKREIIRKICH